MKITWTLNMLFSVLWTHISIARRQYMRFVMTSVSLQMFMAMACFSGLGQHLNLFVLCIVFVLLNVDQNSWMDQSTNSSVFHHLKLQKNAFNVYCFCKIVTASMCFVLFLLINIMPWVIAGMISEVFLMQFVAVTPYFIGLQGIISSLNKGHIHSTYIGPLLMLPLQAPIFFLLLSYSEVPIYIWFLVPLLMTFSLSLVMRISLETVIE